MGDGPGDGLRFDARGLSDVRRTKISFRFELRAMTTPEEHPADQMYRGMNHSSGSLRGAEPSRTYPKLHSQGQATHAHTSPSWRRNVYVTKEIVPRSLCTAIKKRLEARRV